jgi:hypothetical protein
VPETVVDVRRIQNARPFWKTPMKRFRQGGTVGWLTIAGLAAIIVSFGKVNPDSDDKYFWLSVLILGIVCTLLGGIAWSHAPGKRRLKTAFLGLVGCPVGAVLGGFLGYELAEADATLHVEGEIWSVLVGSWVGAALFASGGVWWGITITRRLGQDAGVTRNGNELGDA